MTKFSPRKYLRGLIYPFCPGCGLFSVSGTFLRAVHELGYEDFNDFVFCSGIGCSSWVPSPYFMADSIHTLHGRSIPVATGIKLVRPDLNVVVFGGDGDIAGIGLSHFVHAARRNTDILVIMSNNFVYGMTGGQAAPTTPLGTKTVTTPYGSFEYPLDAAKLAVTAGAAYSARWTTAHLRNLKNSMKTAIQRQGFRFIEILSHCPTAYGRKVGFKDSGEMLKWFKNEAISVQNVKNGDQVLQDRIVIGEFMGRSRPTLVENYYAMLKEVQKNAKKN